jgi:hypothetical protein
MGVKDAAALPPNDQRSAVGGISTGLRDRYRFLALLAVRMTPIPPVALERRVRRQPLLTKQSMLQSAYVVL